MAKDPMQILLNMFATYFLSRRQLANCRKWMDRTLAVQSDAHPWVLATDAMLLIYEGKLEIAEARFRECLATLDTEVSDNSRYLTIYCTLWIATLTETGDLKTLRRMASSAPKMKVTKGIREQLWLPSLTLLENVLLSSQTSVDLSVELKSANEAIGPSGIRIEF